MPSAQPPRNIFNKAAFPREPTPIAFGFAQPGYSRKVGSLAVPDSSLTSTPGASGSGFTSRDPEAATHKDEVIPPPAPFHDAPAPHFPTGFPSNRGPFAFGRKSPISASSTSSTPRRSVPLLFPPPQETMKQPSVEADKHPEDSSTMAVDESGDECNLQQDVKPLVLRRPPSPDSLAHQRQAGSEQERVQQLIDDTDPFRPHAMDMLSSPPGGHRQQSFPEFELEDGFEASRRFEPDFRGQDVFDAPMAHSPFAPVNGLEPLDSEAKRGSTFLLQRSVEHHIDREGSRQSHRRHDGRHIQVKQETSRDRGKMSHSRSPERYNPLQEAARQMEENEEQIQLLRNDNDELTIRLETLEKEKAELDGLVKSLRTELQVAKGDNETVKLAKENSIKSARAQVAKLAASVRVTEATVSELKRVTVVRQKAQDAALASAGEAKEGLSKELAQCKDALVTTAKEAAAAGRKAVASLKAQEEEKVKIIEELTDKINDLTASLKVEEARSQQLAEQHDKLMSSFGGDFETFMSQLRELSKSGYLTADVVTSLKNEIASRESDLQGACHEVSAKEEIIADLTAQIEASKGSVMEVQKSLDAQAVQHEKEMQAFKALQVETEAKLSAERNQLQAQNEALTRQTQELQTALVETDASAREKEMSLREAITLNTRLKDKESHIKSLDALVKSAEGSAKAVREELDAQKSAMQMASSTYASEVEDLRSALSTERAKAKNLGSLQVTVQVQEAELKSLTTELSAKSADVLSLTGDLGKRQQEVATLSEKLEAQIKRRPEGTALSRWHAKKMTAEDTELVTAVESVAQREVADKASRIQMLQTMLEQAQARAAPPPTEAALATPLTNAKAPRAPRLPPPPSSPLTATELLSSPKPTSPRHPASPTRPPQTQLAGGKRKLLDMDQAADACEDRFRDDGIGQFSSSGTRGATPPPVPSTSKTSSKPPLKKMDTKKADPKKVELKKAPAKPKLPLSTAAKPSSVAKPSNNAKPSRKSARLSTTTPAPPGPSQANVPAGTLVPASQDEPTASASQI